MSKVVWGVLGTARIGLRKVIPGMQKSPWCEIRAIASRSADSARKAADTLGIPVAYGSYEALLADPAIEAIYNPLPNHLHVPMTLAAVRAGKHVLCEKPIALSAGEAASLLDTGTGVKVMEAFMVRFHPQWLRARQLLQQGAIGELRAVQMFFSYRNADPADIRNVAALGGGAIYDIGCYAVMAGRFFFESMPRRAIALIDRDAAFGTDIVSSALVDFGGARQLAFTVSTQCVPFQRLQLCGTRGRIELPVPFNAPQGQPARLLIDDGSSVDGTGIRAETIPASDQYELQGEHFSRAIRGDIGLPFGVDDAIANMRVIDALFRSERSGRWESP
jgi:predicted dehydrogenase